MIPYFDTLALMSRTNCRVKNKTVSKISWRRTAAEQRAAELWVPVYLSRGLGPFPVSLVPKRLQIWPYGFVVYVYVYKYNRYSPFSLQNKQMSITEQSAISVQVIILVFVVISIIITQYPDIGLLQSLISNNHQQTHLNSLITTWWVYSISVPLI